MRRRLFAPPPLPPKWKKDVLALAETHKVAPVDWKAFTQAIQTLALAQPKKWGETRRKAWEAVWLEVSETFTRERVSGLKTKDDWEGWKRATIAWHKPMYEAGVYEWQFETPPDDGVDKRHRHMRVENAMRHLGTKGIIKEISHWGVSWQERKRLDEAGLSLNTPTQKRSSTLVAEFKKMPEAVWTDEHVWQKVLFAEWDDRALPWERFAENLTHVRSHDTAYALQKTDLDTERFWLEEALALPITRHKLGGDKAAWLQSMAPLWVAVKKEVSTWGFYQEWADRHAQQLWPASVISELWGDAVYQSSKPGMCATDTEKREHIHWMLEHHFENFSHSWERNSYGRDTHFKRWRRERGVEWSDWMLSSNQDITPHEFAYIWQALDHRNDYMREKDSPLPFELAEKAIPQGFLDVESAMSDKKSEFQHLFWVDSALGHIKVRDWLVKQLDKEPRLIKGWLQYFKERGTSDAIKRWVKENEVTWERLALKHQCEPKISQAKKVQLHAL
jgi:hypothetical protein